MVPLAGRLMARIRSVKPETWDDRKLARVSRDARLLYVALWNFADEWSRMHGDPRLIKGKVFPYDDDVDPTVVVKWLDELAAHDIRAIVRYEVDGDPYLYLPKLIRHQYLDPVGTPSRLPEPPDFDEDRYLAEPGAKKRTNASLARDSRRSRHYSEETPDQFGETPDYSGDAPDESVHSRLQGAGSREQVTGSRDPSDADDAGASSAGVREDVERLCTHLADRIDRNGFTRPTIGKLWRDAARRLIDLDGHPEDKIHVAIDWCQDDEFWLLNVRSMPKLREQYERLQKEAHQYKGGHRGSGSRGGMSRQEIDQRGTDEMFDRAMTRAQEREARAALTAGGEPS